jgi:shikimate dehydrogenase
LSISGKTKICALIGKPVDHSLSPCIQNAAFQYLDLDFIYVAFEVRPEDIFGAIIGIKSLKIHGLNVTMPLKEKIVERLDQLDENARRIKAVNTIINKQGILFGFNTDGEGALRALEKNNQGIKNKKIVILGAGGASRALCYTLAKQTEEIVILNRTQQKAFALAEELSKTSKSKIHYGHLERSIIEKELENADLLINATSLGMHPNEYESPIDQDLLRSDLPIFDLVYNPIETRLLREAKKIGAPTIGGLNMLVHQGASSFEIWTEEKAPVNIMMTAAQKELKRRKMKDL